MSSNKRIKVQAGIRLTRSELAQLDELKRLWDLDRNEVVAVLVEHALAHPWVYRDGT